MQACGDAHISNFGGFAAPDRTLVFGPNDFDETLPGPVGVGRQADGGEHRDRRTRHRPPGRPPQRHRRSRACASTARRCASSREESHLQVWYDRLDADELTERFGSKLDADRPRALRQAVREGAAQDEHPRAVSKLTERVDGKLRFRSVAAASDAAARAPRTATSATSQLRHSSVSCSSSTPTASTPTGSTSSVPTVRRHGPQGGRRRERRHPRMGLPSRRPRRAGRARASGQGGAGVGARAVPRQERVRERMASGSCAGSA